jgi:hypothetical protein
LPRLLVARAVIDRLRENARADGSARMSMKTIDAVVRDVRRKKNAATAGRRSAGS